MSIRKDGGTTVNGLRATDLSWDDAEQLAIDRKQWRLIDWCVGNVHELVKPSLEIAWTTSATVFLILTVTYDLDPSTWPKLGQDEPYLAECLDQRSFHSKAVTPIICNIRQYLGQHDVDVLCKERHERFLWGLVCWDMLSCDHWQLITAFYSLIYFL